MIRWTVAGLAVAAILTAWILGEDDGVGASAIGAEDPATDWSYEGATGPAHWGELDPEWSLCSEGREQSPVDLAGARDGRVPPVAFDYEPSSATVVNGGELVEIVLDAGTLATRGSRYDLGLVSFHTPGEHEIAGRRFPAEMRLIHSHETEQPIVVAILIEEGEPNPALEEALAQAPAKPDVERPLRSAIDPVDMLPGGGAGAVYSYDGSSTTPPCTEGLRWIVFEQPLELSRGQIDALTKAYPNNARPIQPLGDREVVHGPLG